MEFLEGQSLRQYLNERGPVPMKLAIEWMRQLCGALKEAHAANLVHRDIKLSNIFLVENSDAPPSVKLLDFGLAKAINGGAEETLTESGVVLGSPAYMSPEQVRAASVGSASDIWSLGVVLYEMLSGARPFRGDTSAAILAAIAADPPVPLHSAAPHVSPSLETVVNRCLRKMPSERFASVVELASALDAVATVASSHWASPIVDTFGGTATESHTLHTVGLAAAGLSVAGLSEPLEEASSDPADAAYGDRPSVSRITATQASTTLPVMFAPRAPRVSLGTWVLGGAVLLALGSVGLLGVSADAPAALTPAPEGALGVQGSATAPPVQSSEAMAPESALEPSSSEWTEPSSSADEVQSESGAAAPVAAVPSLEKDDPRELAPRRAVAPRVEQRIHALKSKPSAADSELAATARSGTSSPPSQAERAPTPALFEEPDF
jgi:serine/threonine-protein kinase